MRFRTKIILICCLSVLCSSIICSVTVYDLVKRISLDAAESQSYQNAHVTFSEIEEKISSLVVGKDDSMEHKVLDYILKTQGDEMLLCFASGDRETEIYNDTVFQQTDLSGLSYHSAEVLEQRIDVAEMKWEGRQFLVLRQDHLRIDTYEDAGAGTAFIDCCHYSRGEPDPFLYIKKDAAAAAAIKRGGETDCQRAV